MFGAEALLVDCERMPHPRLGLAKAVGILEELGQVVEGIRVLGMFRTVLGLHRVGVALGQGDCFAKFAGTVKLNHSVVEAAQLSVRLSMCGKGYKCHSEQESTHLP